MVVAALARAGRDLRRALDRLHLFGTYGEAHPRQISDQLPATSPAAHTPTAALLLVALAGLVLAARNRWPRLVLVVSAGAVTVYSLLGYVNGAALLAPVVAVYTLATKETARRAITWSLAVLVVLMGATAVHNPFGLTGGGFFLIPGLIAAACLGGIAIASRRAYVASIETRAVHEAQRRIDRNACESRVTCTTSLRTRWRRSHRAGRARPRTWPPNGPRWPRRRC